ncbi:MAG: ABC transporter substrate-binding protein [Opitutaceae bacterium]|nr:ABC transporter substrate-binding protein [Opitutaceae bacterium]
MRTPLRLLAVFWFLCSLLGAAEPAAGPVRVVSQTVGSDELLLALAEPAQIAALSHLSRKPEFSVVAQEAEKYPRIGLGDAETMLKFTPTLVLVADYSRAEWVTQLQRAGVRVLVFDRYKTLEDCYANLRLLARELGAEARAEAVIAACEARVTALRAKLAGVRPVRVIAPSTYGMIPGDETTFADLCAHAGAENLAATLGHLHGHAAVPSEQMLSWPVEAVVLMGSERETALAPYRGLVPYKFMAAVREGRAVLIAASLMSCVTHYRIDAYEQLARQLHPEVFP